MKLQYIVVGGLLLFGGFGFSFAQQESIVDKKYTSIQCNLPHFEYNNELGELKNRHEILSQLNGEKKFKDIREKISCRFSDKYLDGFFLTNFTIIPVQDSGDTVYKVYGDFYFQSKLIARQIGVSYDKYSFSNNSISYGNMRTIEYYPYLDMLESRRFYALEGEYSYVQDIFEGGNQKYKIINNYNMYADRQNETIYHSGVMINTYYTQVMFFSGNVDKAEKSLIFLPQAVKGSGIVVISGINYLEINGDQEKSMMSSPDGFIDYGAKKAFGYSFGGLFNIFSGNFIFQDNINTITLSNTGGLISLNPTNYSSGDVDELCNLKSIWSKRGWGNMINLTRVTQTDSGSNIQGKISRISGYDDVIAIEERGHLAKVSLESSGSFLAFSIPHTKNSTLSVSGDIEESQKYLHAIKYKNNEIVCDEMVNISNGVWMGHMGQKGGLKTGEIIDLIKSESIKDAPIFDDEKQPGSSDGINKDITLDEHKRRGKVRQRIISLFT